VFPTLILPKFISFEWSQIQPEKIIFVNMIF
jgi:hypothetical protein